MRFVKNEFLTPHLTGLENPSVALSNTEKSLISRHLGTAKPDVNCILYS
jgi:hypothetical protein